MIWEKVVVLRRWDVKGEEVRKLATTAYSYCRDTKTKE
jgi:hypothetical protein